MYIRPLSLASHEKNSVRSHHWRGENSGWRTLIRPKKGRKRRIVAPRHVFTRQWSEQVYSWALKMGRRACAASPALAAAHFNAFANTRELELSLLHLSWAPSLTSFGLLLGRPQLKWESYNSRSPVRSESISNKKRRSYTGFTILHLNKRKSLNLKLVKNPLTTGRWIPTTISGAPWTISLVKIVQNGLSILG